MGIVLGDNIEYKGKKPLDSRMLFDTIADMKEYSENYLPDITLAFNKEDSKMYVFNRENEVDSTTGKWRIFESESGGVDYIYKDGYFVLGNIYAANSYNSAKNRITLVTPVEIGEGVEIKTKTGRQMGVYFATPDSEMTDNNSFSQAASGWVTTYTTGNQGTYYFAFKRNDDSDFNHVDYTVEDVFDVEDYTPFKEKVVEQSSVWKDKVAVFVGDSITAGAGATSGKLYYNYLQQMLGLKEVHVNAEAGRCVSVTSDYGTQHTPLTTQLNNIPVADLICIFMGTNDYGHGTPMGKFAWDTADTDTSFYTALRRTFSLLKNKYPLAQIVWFTPLHRKNLIIDGQTQLVTDDTPNAQGLTLRDYVNTIKEVAAEYGISVVDLYSQCKLNPRMQPYVEQYMSDGLHPNSAGHKEIAKVAAAYLRSMTFNTQSIKVRKSLNELDDTTITTPADGDILSFNETSGQWENKTVEEKIYTDSVYLTQTEYDALTPEEQEDETKDYYIISNDMAVPADGIRLSDMDDVATNNIEEGDILLYNNNNVWGNVNLEDTYLKDHFIETNIIADGTATSTGFNYGVYFKDGTTLKSIDISFVSEGTYNWWIYSVENIAVGERLTLVKSGTATAGEPLELNYTFSDKEIFFIDKQSYYRPATTSKVLGMAATPSAGGTTITQKLAVMFSGTYVFDNKDDKYVLKDGGINNITDVTISEVHNGESIVYDSVNQTFINKDLRGLIANKVDVTNIQTGMLESDGQLFGEFLPAAYVKSVKINFPEEVTTYTWYIYRVEGELVGGSSVTLLETGTGTAGEAIELNRYFSGREAIAIGDGTKFYHGNTGGDKFFHINPTTNKIVRFIKNYRFSWTCIYEGYAEKYAENDLSGKKIMLLGDSLTDPRYAKRGQVIAEKNQMTMDNRAISGAYMYNDETSQYKEHAIYKKVCNPEATNYIPDSAFEGVDYIIVYGGTNDARFGSMEVGDVNSTDTSTFCGSLNAICNTLQTRAPSAHIGFITTFRYSDQFSAKHLQIAQATKDVCAKYSIPVFDQTTESGINWNNAEITSTLTRNDRLHLNEAGNEFVAQKYEAFIRRI